MPVRSLQPNFVAEGQEHIVIGSAGFLDLLLPELSHLGITEADMKQFKLLWKYGPKLRFIPSTGTLDAETRNRVLQSIYAGADSYEKKFIKRFPDVDLAYIGQYIHVFKANIKEQIDRCPDGMSLSLMDIRQTLGAPDITLDKVKIICKVLHKYFVVTVADKVTNAFVATCKPCYFTKLAQVKQQSHYASVPQGELDVFQSTREGLHAIGAGFMEGQDRLAYANLLPKLHKPLIPFRVLTCCKGIQLSKVGTWLTSIMRVLLPGANTIWKLEVKRGGLKGIGADKPFFILHSKDVVGMIKNLNQSKMPSSEFWERGGAQGFDWTDMYTNLPMEDLASLVIQEALRPCWFHVGNSKETQHPDPVLKVYSYKGYKPIWYKDLATGIQRNKRNLEEGGVREDGQPTGEIICGKDQQGEFLLITLAQVEALYSFLLEHAYIKIFATILRQIKGIPIGISPGVYIATLVAFVYELRFLRQLVDIIVSCNPDDMGKRYVDQYDSEAATQAGWQPDPALEAYKGNAARYVWASFKYTARFVDDIESLANSLMKRLLHQSQSIAGGLISGLYPDTTPIIEQQHEDLSRFPFLDTLQLFADHEGFIRCLSHLYDKRREKCYDLIERVQYTPPVAGLSDSCLYNIFVGQLFRYQRIITDMVNYEEEVALLVSKLVGLGFKELKLRAKLKRHLHNHEQNVFPGESRTELVTRIWSRVEVEEGDSEGEELMEVQEGDLEGEELMEVEEGDWDGEELMEVDGF